MPDAAFYLMASARADIKRLPALVGGKRGEAEPHLWDVVCTPLDPISEATQVRFGLASPHTVRECFIEAGDVVKGDVLVMDGKDYPIQQLEARQWETDNSRYLHLIVQASER